MVSLLSLVVAVVLYYIFSFQSKAVAKTGGGKYQWQIMQSLGISNDEIKKFADASYWLHHFPPLAVKDLRSIGIHVRMVIL
jgi:leucyl-tRNA synthetase